MGEGLSFFGFRFARRKERGLVNLNMEGVSSTARISKVKLVPRDGGWSRSRSSLAFGSAQWCEVMINLCRSSARNFVRFIDHNTE